MSSQIKFDVTITKDFNRVWENFLELIDGDKEFEKLIKEKKERDKRFREKPNNCAKVRYAIAYYNKKRRLELLEKNKGESKNESS